MLNFIASMAASMAASMVFVAPLLAAMVIGLGILFNHFQDEPSERFIGRLSTSAVLLSLFSAAGLLIFNLLKPEQLPASLPLLEWFSRSEERRVGKEC